MADGTSLLINVQLIIIPTKPSIQTTEQSINNVIMLKHFVTSVNSIYEGLTGARSWMLNNIREVRKSLVSRHRNADVHSALRTGEHQTNPGADRQRYQ